MTSRTKGEHSEFFSTPFGKKDYSAFYHSAYIAIGALPYALSSMFRVWASPLLFRLQSEDSPIGRDITHEEGTWFVSSYYIGMTTIGMFAGLLVDTFGRKPLLLTSSLFLCIPCVLIYFATNIGYIIVGRFLAGAGTNLANIVLSLFVIYFVLIILTKFKTSILYCKEISEKRSKDYLDVLLITFKINGTSLILLINPYMSHLHLTILVFVSGIACFILFNFLPESPYYLLMNGQEAKAKENFKHVSSFVYGHTALQSPYAKLKKRVTYDQMHRMTVWGFVKAKHYRNSFVLILTLKTLMHLSGVCAIEAYTHTIIDQTSSTFSTEVSSTVIGAVLLPAFVVTGTFLRSFGRREILIISCLGSAVALTGEATYFFMQDHLQSNTRRIEWLPTMAISTFYVMNYLGIASLPYLIMPETFPSDCKSSAASCLGTYGGILGFLVSKFYQPLTVLLGVYTVLWLFAGHCLLGCLFVFCFLPETKNVKPRHTQSVLRSAERITHYSRMKIEEY